MARLMPGKCRWCGCTEDAACPDRRGGGCRWADARETLCTFCVRVDAAWRSQVGARPPNMRLAFFRGFLHGTKDSRAQGDGSNPYARGAAQHGFWRRAFEAGATGPAAIGEGSRGGLAPGQSVRGGGD